MLHKKYLNKALPILEFTQRFHQINNSLWDDFSEGIISREEIREIRFKKVFELFGINNEELSVFLSKEYTRLGPEQKNLIPGALPLLEYLRNNYSLYIITNGFEDIQNKKLKYSGISHFFDDIITSEKAGINKPHPQIFEYALKLSGTSRKESLMVGDNLISDVRGSINSKIDIAFFNPAKVKHSESVSYELNRLDMLMEIL